MKNKSQGLTKFAYFHGGEKNYTINDMKVVRILGNQPKVMNLGKVVDRMIAIFYKFNYYECKWLYKQ